MIADCEMSQKENDIPEYGDGQYSNEQLAGHDFWLTRNGHGAGFWDRDLGEIGERLTKASEAYGSGYFWIENGKVFGEFG
jgi:hypothetical protein